MPECILDTLALPRVLVEHLKKMQRFKQTGYSRYIYRNELDKACFQHDMAYGGFKI